MNTVNGALCMCVHIGVISVKPGFHEWGGPFNDTYVHNNLLLEITGVLLCPPTAILIYL